MFFGNFITINMLIERQKKIKALWAAHVGK
jgi:hypothetical protein